MNATGAAPAAVAMELRSLVAAYAHGVDSRNYEEVAQLFALAGVLRSRRTLYPDEEQLYELRGRGEILRRLRDLDRFDRTFHQLGQHTITLEDGGATGLAYCTANHLRRRSDHTSLYVMFIRYEDRYVVEDGAWRFAERLLWLDMDETRVVPNDRGA